MANEFIGQPHLAALMAEGDAAEFQRKAVFGFFTLLLIAGIVIYWMWGLEYDTWYPFTRGNIGIFSVYTPLIAFGVIGMLLYKKKPVKA